MMFLLKKIYRLFKANKLNKLKDRFLKCGKDIVLNSDLIVSFPERLSIGNYIYIGPNANINAIGNVEINDGVIIGPNFIVHSANHRFRDSKSIPYDEKFDFRKVIIEENVWIGGNVILTPGSHIGEGAIIGTGSVVSGSIPPFAIAVGNPVQIKKYRDKEHYFRLKNEGKVYLKMKLKGEISPNYEN